MKHITYKVLWIDDLCTEEDRSFSDGLSSVADEKNLQLCHFSNWEEAEYDLRRNFDTYSAIILDAFCKIKKDDILPNEGFIPEVIAKLNGLFVEKRQHIPWYILSAGTMSNFNFVVDIARSLRESHQDEWGKMLYFKDAIDDNDQSVDYLMNNICSIARNQAINIVTYNYRNVFKYLGENKLIDQRARTIMLKMLCALYYPEDNRYFQYNGNPLRKVMEYIFRAAYKYNLLPKECFERDDQLNLLESNRYMSGEQTKHSKLRYGTDSDNIFPKYLGQITRQILNFANVDSHTNETNPYTIEDKDLEITANEKELFFGYVLQLCHVIKYFGSFVESHSDKGINKSMIKFVCNSSDPVGITDTIQLTESKNPYIANCRLAPSFIKHVGKSAKIESVETNTGKDALSFPYYAKIKIIE